METKQSGTQNSFLCEKTRIALLGKKDDWKGIMIDDKIMLDKRKWSEHDFSPFL